MKKYQILNLLILIAVIFTGCSDKWKKEFEIEPDPPIADFSYTIMQLTPGEVIFFNHSLHATKYLWKFGDGNTSTVANPTHVYKEKGTYTVSLTAINDVGFQVVNDNVTIDF